MYIFAHTCMVRAELGSLDDHVRKTAQRNARKLRDPRSYVEKAADKHKRKCVDRDGDPAKKEAKTKADAINDPRQERTLLPTPIKAIQGHEGSAKKKADAINDPGRERTPLPTPIKANQSHEGSAKTKADAINDPGRKRTPLPTPMKANKVQRGSVPEKIKTLLPAASEPWTDIS